MIDLGESSLHLPLIASNLREFVLIYTIQPQKNISYFDDPANL